MYHGKLVVYIASLGNGAATNPSYWPVAKERFRFSESIIFCGRNLVEKVTRRIDPNSNLVIIENPFYGADGYIKAIRDIAKQLYAIVERTHKQGNTVDELIINTSGGTEKMSCIIKDTIPVLEHEFGHMMNIVHVWGASSGYTTKYTVKPKVDVEHILSTKID